MTKQRSSKIPGHMAIRDSSDGQHYDVGDDNPVPVQVTGFDFPDIEIGAVELKDGATDTRATIKAASTPPEAADTALVVTLRDGAGAPKSPSATVLTTQRPAVTQVLSTALEASHILSAAPGQLVQLSVFNSKSSAQFILLMNAASLPADGAVTLLYPPIPIAANSLLVLDMPAPLVASAGIVVCNSSTGSFTKTIGSADCAFYAQVN